MDNLVTNAADVLHPLIALGASGIAAGAAEKVGSDLWDSAHVIVTRLRRRRSDIDTINRAELAAELNVALRDETIDGQLLQRLVDLARQTGYQPSITYMDVSGKARNVYQGSTIHIHGESPGKGGR